MSATVGERLTNTWWLVLLEGIAAFILGVFLLTAPGMTIATLVVFVGAFWLVSGIFSIVTIFVADSGVHWGWLLVGGIVGILAGIAVLRHPLYSAVLIPTTLVIILGIAGIIKGVIHLVQSFKGDGWWAVIVGALHIIFGVVLLASPLVTALVVLLLIGILGIIGGIILVAYSFRMRSEKEPTTAS